MLQLHGTCARDHYTRSAFGEGLCNARQPLGERFGEHCDLWKRCVSLWEKARWHKFPDYFGVTDRKSVIEVGEQAVGDRTMTSL